MSRTRLASLAGLVALMGGSGVLHMVRPRIYEPLIPPWLAGSEREVIYVSGVAEIVCALLLAVPRTRRVGAWATAGVLVAVFPGNIQMAVDGGVPGAAGPLGSPVVAWARLPIQPVLIWWALRFRHDEGTR